MTEAYYLRQCKLNTLNSLTLDEIKLILVVRGVVDVLYCESFPLLALSNLSTDSAEILHEELSSFSNEHKSFLINHLTFIIHVDDCPDSVHW